MRWPRRPRPLLGVVALALLAAGIAAAVLSTTQGPRPHSAGRTTTTRGEAPSTSTPGTAPSTTTPGRSVPHVMLIVMENHGYAQIVGSPTAPYLNELADRYGLATDSYAVAHPSLPNYLDLVSGSTQGVADDCTTCTANAPRIVDQLQHTGITWRAHMEGAPSACFTGSDPPFDRHHDPFVYAPHIVGDAAERDRVVPFSTFEPSLSNSTLPPFVWVTPDVDHDMHTGTVAAGDAWLRTTLTFVLDSSWYRQDGAVIITFDESTGGTDAGCCTAAAGGHIPTFVISRRTPHDARMATPLDDAGVLRTIEALYRLAYLGAAANPQSGTLLPLLGLPRAAG